MPNLTKPEIKRPRGRPRKNGEASTPAAIAPRSHRRRTPARCRVCSCTEFAACNPPCSWTEPDLCSTCAEHAAVTANWLLSAHRPTWHALRLEVEAMITKHPDALFHRFFGGDVPRPGVQN